MPVICKLELRRVVGEALGGLVVRWMDPAKSCSTTPAEDRITLAARYEKDALTEAQRLALFGQIRRQLGGKRAFMSEEDIFAETAPRCWRPRTPRPCSPSGLCARRWLWSALAWPRSAR